MITSLSLDNWKSHSHSEFSFGRGTNVLVGRMGSGKSSVLDALCFALYGTFPKVSRRDQSVESLVNLSSGAEFARVELGFEKGGKGYSVMRKVGRKVSEAEVRCGGKLVQKGARPATEYVEGVLGVDYELFTRAIYSEQNRMDYLLSLNPKQRKGEIDWLLGLGQFDSAREAAQSAHSKLSEQASSLASEADAARLEEISGKAAAQEGIAKQKRERLELLAKSAAQAFAKKNGLEASLAAMEKTRARWTQESAECERQEGALQRLRKEAESKERPGQEKLDSLAAERKKAEAALGEAKQALRKAQSELSAAKSELAVTESSAKLARQREERKEKLQRKLEELLSGKSEPQLEAEISALKSEVDALSRTAAQLHAQMDELSGAVKALASGAAKCPVCDSDLGQGKAGKISSGKKSEIEVKRALAKQSEKEMDGAKARLSALEKAVSEIRLLSSEKERISTEGAEPAQLEKLIREKTAGKKSLEGNCSIAEKETEDALAALENAARSLEEAQRTGKIFAELEAASQKLASSQQRLASLSFSEDGYEEVRKAAEALRLDYARAESEAKSEEKQLALVEELASSLRREAQELGRKRNLAARYSGAASSMAIFKNCLSSAQSELRGALVEEINAALCEIWPAVYPYSDYSGVKLEADEKDYRLLMDKGGWREVDSVASGGERACLCLALRIAFATVLTPDVGWLILDEPTHNLDSDAVALLSEAIGNKIPSIVEQTFVITHDPALGETGEGQVWRLERDKGKNESTRVEKQG